MVTWEIATTLKVGEDYSDSIKSLFLHFLKQPKYGGVSAKFVDPITIKVFMDKSIISIKAEVI